MMSRIRYPLLAFSLLLLLLAIWAGLLRLGWRWPVLLSTLPISHGPLMVSGFLGTLIGLERAVALGARWAYLGPLATALGGIMLLFSLGGNLGALLIVFGSLVLVLIFIHIVRRHMAVYTVTMALGALVWLAGNLLWLTGRPIYQIVLWWAGFLILTIAGERLELGRLLSLSGWVLRAFVIIIGLFLVGLVVSLWLPDLGTRLAGLSMVALAIWLFRYDIARKTVRKPGLPRYTAGSGYLDPGIRPAGSRAAVRCLPARHIFGLCILHAVCPRADHLPGRIGQPGGLQSHLLHLLGSTAGFPGSQGDRGPGWFLGVPIVDRFAQWYRLDFVYWNDDVYGSERAQVR
jgi:hypothetical protein